MIVQFTNRSPQHCCIRACLFALALLCLPSVFAQNLAELDPTKFNIIVESNISITMRDGVNISVDIYRPADGRTYSTFYASGPYSHSSDNSPPNNPLTGPVAWYVDQGYVYVLASSRGTGRSEGNYELLSREEQQDHYEIIEWIAEQEWSNGKVAGIGSSYYATSQWLMAIQNPPHLECIAPFGGIVDPYHEWAYPGGLASNNFIQGWYEQQVRQSNAFPASGPARLVEYDLRFQQLLHPYYDDYWRLRTSLENVDKISMPVFIMAHWKQNESGINSTIKAMESLNSTNKIIITETKQNQSYSLYQDQQFLQQELMPFYDWCLNDNKNTTFIEQPRIRYFVKGQAQAKQESRWPPGNVTSTPLFLNSEGLNFKQLENSSPPKIYGSDSENSSAVFISEVLQQDTDIAGPLGLELYASSSANDTAFTITLSEQIIFRQIPQSQRFPSFLETDVADNVNITSANTLVEVSSGSLKASARNSTSQPTLLNPERINRFDITLQNTAYRFKRGSRIVLEVQQANDGSLTNKPAQDSIFHNARYPSRLWLPIVQSSIRQAQNATTQSSETFPTEEELAPGFDFLNSEKLPTDEQNPVIYVR